MNKNEFSKLELVSFVDSALIAVAAVLIVVAHLVVPITLQSVYVGTLTAISAICLSTILVLGATQVCVLIAIFAKSHVRRLKTLSVFIASLGLFSICGLISNYLIAKGLQRAAETDVVSLMLMTICLLSAYFFWRKNRN